MVEHFHGKEGVPGSSPGRGSRKNLYLMISSEHSPETQTRLAAGIIGTVVEVYGIYGCTIAERGSLGSAAATLAVGVGAIVTAAAITSEVQERRTIKRVIDLAESFTRGAASEGH